MHTLHNVRDVQDVQDRNLVGSPTLRTKPSSPPSAGIKAGPVAPLSAVFWAGIGE